MNKKLVFLISLLFVGMMLSACSTNSSGNEAEGENDSNINGTRRGGGALQRQLPNKRVMLLKKRRDMKW